MRRWIALITALTILLLPFCTFAEDVISANTEIPEKNAPLKLLGALYEEQNMLVFSPLSLSVALGMAAEGASGETLNQLNNFLGKKHPNWAVLEDLRFSGVKLANTALLRSDFSLLPSYEAALTDIYEAEPLLMDNGSVKQQVNEWVSENTDGMIENFLSEEPDLETKLLLINALHMKAEWLYPFNPASTGFAVFHAPQGDIEVSSMRQTSPFLYGKTDGVQAVVLPYQDSALEMVVLLPEDGDLQKLLSNLCTAPDEFIQRHLPSETTLVHLSLPNIFAESSFEMKDALIKLGVTDAFDPDLSDFSAMSEEALERDLYIASVLQKAVLNVNEAGTEASAATQVAMNVRSMMPQETVEMNVDRPFMLLVQDSVSGYVLFAACINNPA